MIYLTAITTHDLNWDLFFPRFWNAPLDEKWIVDALKIDLDLKSSSCLSLGHTIQTEQVLVIIFGSVSCSRCVLPCRLFSTENPLWLCRSAATGSFAVLGWIMWRHLTSISGGGRCKVVSLAQKVFWRGPAECGAMWAKFCPVFSVFKGRERTFTTLWDSRRCRTDHAHTKIESMHLRESFDH